VDRVAGSNWLRVARGGGVSARELDELRVMLREELGARARIDCDTHALHHDYVAELIERSRRRAARWETIRTQVAGWATIAALASLGTYMAREIARVFATLSGR
jgi:hypothetical protein